MGLAMLEPVVAKPMLDLTPTLHSPITKQVFISFLEE